jgi:hypothetical protein
MKKPFLAALLAALAVLSLAAQEAPSTGVLTAAGDFVFSPEGNGLTITRYKGSASMVNIPPGIDGIPVTAIGEWAFFWCRSLTSITIPNSVTAIERGAFDGCDSLTGIMVDAGNRQYRDINGILFSKDGKTLVRYPAGKTHTSYTIPDSVTAIGDSAFSDCRSLTVITIPDGVTAIGRGAFSGCRSLTVITIPNSVTAIGRMAFFNCDSLTSITIPAGVTAIGDYAFSGCRSLTGITVDAWNRQYHSINGILFSKDGKTLVRYPVGKTYTSYTIPDSVTAIGAEAFANCSSLTGITIPSSVTAIGAEAFANCSSLTGITVDAWNRQYRDINGILFSKDGKTLVRYPVGKTYTSYTIPDSVTAIGDSAFYGCSSLASITIPDSVTAIEDWAFANCSSLEGIIIPDSVTAIGDSAFYGCSSLASITIPDSVTAIGEGAFSDCGSLSAADREAIRRRFGDEVF